MAPDALPDLARSVSPQKELDPLSSPETSKTVPALRKSGSLGSPACGPKPKSLSSKKELPNEDQICTPIINIAPYMSKFVRHLHADDEEPINMPFSYTQFGAVLMVDIVGFSQMTSIASSKGDVGAEMLSSQIGAYFDQAIRIIEFHGGDVVKFLGDALLVVFQADPDISLINHQKSDSSILDSPTEDSAATLRRNKITVRKAVECGLELLARLSNYRIYLSEREFSRKLSGQAFNTDDFSAATSSGAANENGQTGGASETVLNVNGVQGENRTTEGNGIHVLPTSNTGMGSLNLGFGSSGLSFTPISPSRRSSLNTDITNSPRRSTEITNSPRRSTEITNSPRRSAEITNSPRRSSLLHNSTTTPNDRPSGSARASSLGSIPPGISGNSGIQRASLTIPDSPASTRVPSSKNVPVNVPVMVLPDSTVGSTLSIASSNLSNPTTSNSAVATAPLGPGGVAGFRKRTESVNSLSPNRPGSTSSRSKTTGFLSNAKTLFVHGNSNDIKPLAGSGFTGAAVGNTDGGEGTEDAASSEESHDLQLHMALSAGDIVNIIIGDSGHDEGLENLLVQETGRLEYAICGEQMATIDEALNMARAGEVTVTKSAWKYVNPDAYPWSEPRRNCFILRNIQTSSMTDLPLLRRVRNEKLLSTSIENNSQYYKYINKSAIHRLILYPDNTFPAQFRNSTILFISLGDVKPWTPEGLAHCQKAILAVHKVTSTFEGFIQQFAVDDKGATLLCAFGLPSPQSHENEAVFASKSAWMIRQRFLEAEITGFKISLATGVIFTSMIGNEFRRDPAIVGDTIVIAVRILKFEYATNSIICDDATRSACISEHDGLCEFEDMGDEYVKGKLYPLRIWRLVHFGAKKQTRRPDDVMVDETIGYEPERERVLAFISAWAELPDHNTILITGPRGSGKGMFYQLMIHLADSLGYQICSAASAEVEKNTEYYQCKFLLLGLFDIMRTHHIPYATKFLTRGVAPPLPDDSSVASTADTSNLSDQEDQQGADFDPSDQTAASTDLPIKPFDRRRSSAFSADMSASPTFSQYAEPSSRPSTSMTKLQAFISVCLRKMGVVDLMMLPVLDDIISTISSDNSAPIVNHSDDEILTDFIISTLNYASQFVKIIVMFEDIQWCDSKSLDVIRAVHERCPAVLIVLFSRPQRDYGGGLELQGITSHLGHLEISLDGLKRREIELALLRSFRPNGVTSISPEVIELVQERTKGNPKFVKNMSDMLKEFCHVNIVDGELLTTGQESTPSLSSKTMDEMIMKQDRKKMTLMQYDRVRPKFQDFLKIASCLGEKFSLAEVNAIRPLESLLGTPEVGRSYATIISDMDPFRFLSLATDQQANIQFSDNPDLQTIYTFGSGSTARDIYDSIPYEERVNYHLKMAQFYESFITAADDESTAEYMTCQDLLPNVTRHYMKTEYTAKKIKYLKALAAYELKSNMLTDSSQNVSAIIDILDTVPGAKDLVSQEDLADIYGMKGESLSKRMRIEEAEPALLESLTQYGIHWPSTHLQWKTEMMKQKWGFMFNFFRGATPIYFGRNGKRPKPKVHGMAQIRLQRIVQVFSCLQNIFFWRTQPEAAMLSSLYTLHYSRELGLPSGDQTASLGRVALLLYFQGKKKKCTKYMEVSRKMNAAGQTTEGMLPSMDAYVEYCEGRQMEAHHLLDVAIDESKTFGVVTHLATFYRAVTMKSAYRTWEGGFNVHPEDCQILRTLSVVAIQNGDSEGETLFAIPTLSNLLLQDRLRDAESWVVLIEKYIMPKARLMNLLIIHGILSYYYSRLGDYGRSRIYVELMSENIEQQGVGAHPFPLMGCMFTLMSMYDIKVNAHRSCPSSNEDILRQKWSEKVLRHVMAYLSTDPFKILANTFICWADAMCSFVHPGHEKEGAEKLTRGYKELAGRLEGMNFVRAYFLTLVGRHSDPMTKDEYYKEAHRLFLIMSMNPLLWLTDPTTSWRPPPVEEGPFDFIIGDIPMPANADTLKEGTLGWAAAEVTGASIEPSKDNTQEPDTCKVGGVATAVVPLKVMSSVDEVKQKPAPVVPSKQSQLGDDDPYGHDYVAHNFLALGEGSFDWILAEGSSASATRGRIPEAPI